MDLSEPREHSSFRHAFREWLAENVPAEPLPSIATPEGAAAHRQWERTVADAGYAAVHWPRKYGGRDANPLLRGIFDEEYIRAGAPARISGIGVNLLGPTLMRFGTEQQKNELLPTMLRGEIVWAQGFSEPDSGSDLASVRTRAELHGDSFVVNGQKVWTTLGHVADRAFVLVRTDPNVEKHAGLSLILVDLAADGVEVRPLQQINGDSHFSQVSFTNVVVPRDNIVGKINDGWHVATTLLSFERSANSGRHIKFLTDVENLARLAVTAGCSDDPSVVERLGELYADALNYAHYAQWFLAAASSDKPPPPNVNKIRWTELEVKIFETAIDLFGPVARVDGDGPATRAAFDPDAGLWSNWLHRYWYSRAAPIFGGTNEIQRNMIAERILGLPRERTTRSKFTTLRSHQRCSGIGTEKGAHSESAPSAPSMGISMSD